MDQAKDYLKDSQTFGHQCKHKYESGVADGSIAFQLASEKEDLLTFVSASYLSISLATTTQGFFNWLSSLLEQMLWKSPVICLGPYTGQGGWPS